MATSKGGAKGEKKGKKPHKNKPTSKKYSHYNVSGDKVTKKNRNCPRCGGGVFLAEHKDRVSCGKCNYTEFTRK